MESIEAFKGHSFHTSRWDYEYTGGDSYGNLEGLKDKRVAIIGTGATAIQAVPHLGASAKKLFVFQRTPSSVDIRANRPTEKEWSDALQPGWQQHRMENFSTLTFGGFAEEDLVSDGWTEIIGNLLRRRNAAPAASNGDARTPDAESIGKIIELADFEKMNQVRASADSVVNDPATAESLKPCYRQFCKRPCFHDEYLNTYNLPGVTLVDTAGRGIERITERGVVANGQEFEVDCIIYASGFEVGTPMERRAGYQSTARVASPSAISGRTASRQCMGCSHGGFPNCFIVGLAQVGSSANITHVLDVQSRHISYVIQQAREQEASTVDVEQEAEDKLGGHYRSCVDCEHQVP